MTDDVLTRAAAAAHEGNLETLGAILGEVPDVVRAADAAAWLLDHGADPDLRHDWGGQGHGINAVAMHLAASHDAAGFVELLLDRGADATIVGGAHGGTTLGWAEFGGAPSTTALLRERGAP